MLHYSTTKYTTQRMPPTNNTRAVTKVSGPCLVKRWYGKTYHSGKRKRGRFQFTLLIR